jgi:hypothetical protein
MIWLIKHLDPDFKVWHKLASIWVAMFWGALGGVLSILPFLVNMGNILWLGPLIIFMSITFAVARFTKQPGVE